MSFHSFLARYAVLVLAAVAVATQTADAQTGDGLVSVRNWTFDQLYLRPDTDLTRYRSVMIDPVQVSFRPDWNRNFVDPHASVRRLTQDDISRIADDAAAGLQSALSEAFRARGYSLVTAPGPGVLRLSPALTDMYVNAVEDLYGSGTTKSFTKDAGEATLALNVRDADTGTLLGRIVDRRTAAQTRGTQRGDLIRSPLVTSSFWFEDLFRKWSVACVKELEGGKAS